MNVLRLTETMLMNKVEFLEKTVFFLVRPETYWVMCYYKIKLIKLFPLKTGKLSWIAFLYFEKCPFLDKIIFKFKEFEIFVWKKKISIIFKIKITN